MAHIEEEVVKGGIGIREGLVKIVARSNAETLAWVMLRQRLVDAEDEGESEEELASLREQIEEKDRRRQEFESEAKALKLNLELSDKLFLEDSKAENGQGVKKSNSSSKGKSDYNTRLKKDDLPKLTKDMSVGKVMKWKKTMAKFVASRSFTSEGIKTMLSDSVSEAIMAEMTLAQVWDEDLSFEELSNKILHITLGDDWMYRVEENVDTFELSPGEKFFTFCLRFEEYVRVMGVELMESDHIGTILIEKIKKKLPREVSAYLFEREKILPLTHDWSWTDFKQKLRDLDNDAEYRNWRGLKNLLSGKKSHSGNQKNQNKKKWVKKEESPKDFASNKTCFSCGEKGHLSSNCPNRGKKKQGEGGWISDPKDPSKKVFVTFDRTKQLKLAPKKLSEVLLCAVCRSKGIPERDCKHFFDKCPFIKHDQTFLASSSGTRSGTGSEQGSDSEVEKDLEGHPVYFAAQDTHWLFSREEEALDPLWKDSEVEDLASLDEMCDGMSAAEAEMCQYAVGLSGKEFLGDRVFGKDEEIPKCFLARVISGPDERVESNSSSDPCYLATKGPGEQVGVPDSSCWKNYQNKYPICRNFIPVPILIGNVPVTATYDTGASYSLVTRALWDLLDGEVFKVPIDVSGIISSKVEKYAKWVRVFHGKYVVEALVWPTDATVV